MFSKSLKILLITLFLGGIASAAYFPTVSIDNFNALGVYNFTPPALTDGQTSNLQLDSSGRLITSISGIPQLPASLGPQLSSGSLSMTFASDATAPLPVGGATSSLQTTGNTSLSSIDSKITTSANGIKVDVQASALPTNAANATNQATANASLSSIDGKTPALGQALSAASAPVVLPAAQVTALTPPTTVTVQQPTGTNLHTVVDSSALPTGAALDATVAAMSAKLPNPGPAASAAAQPVVIANDQIVPISGVMNVPQILNNPSSNTLTTLNSTVQYQVTPGASYLLSVVPLAGATTAFSGTVSFTYSTDGITYNAIVGYPLSGGPLAQSASSSTTVGIWNFKIPASLSSTVYLRAQMTSYASGTVAVSTASYSATNISVLLPWTYSVTSGNVIMGPLDASGINEIDLHISALTTTQLQCQVSGDPTASNWQAVYVQDIATTSAGSTAISTVSSFRCEPHGGKYVRIVVTTTGTVLTMQGITAHYGQNITITGAGNAIAISNSPAVTVASGVVTTVSSVTSGNLGTPSLISDVASAALTTTTTTAAFTPTFGVGNKVTIPVTAVSGTTPTMSVVVQESGDNGTNWVPVYTFPTITTTGYYESPALFFKGTRVRYAQTVTGTTPSFTRAINRLQMSAIAATPVNNNATFATATVSTSCSTLTAPTNAVGFILENLSTNVVNMFWTLGATPATSTTGMLLEPGRDTGEVHAGVNVSLCAASGTPTYSIQWVQQ